VLSLWAQAIVNILRVFPFTREMPTRHRLGQFPIHKEIREELLKEKNCYLASDRDIFGHFYLKFQFAFLQRVLGDFSFVPVVMGDQHRQVCSELAKAIVRTAANRNILIIASSDLSHYHPTMKLFCRYRCHRRIRKNLTRIVYR